MAVMIVFITVMIPDIHSQTQYSNKFEFTVNPDSVAIANKNDDARRALVIDSVIQFGKKFVGLKYKYGGSTEKGFDCSGYVSYIFRKYGYQLPHSSASMAKVGDKVELKDAAVGDLILFKGRSSKSKTVGHVALIIKADSGQVTMMHSCVQRGVYIEKYNNNPYYNSRYVMCRRISL